MLASPQSKVADLAGIKSKPQGKPDFDRLRINIACLNSLDLSWHGSHVQAPALVHQRLLTSSSIPRGFCWKLWLHGASNRCCQDAAGPKRHSACPAAKNSTGLLDKVGVQAVPPPTRLKPMNYLSYLNLSEPLTRGHGLAFLKPMLNLHENCVLHLGIVTPFLITIPVRLQWGRYNLPRIYTCCTCCCFTSKWAFVLDSLTMRDGNVTDSSQRVLICSNCFECNEKPVKVVQCLSEHGKSSDSENDFSFKI